MALTGVDYRVSPNFRQLPFSCSFFLRWTELEESTFLPSLTVFFLERWNGRWRLDLLARAVASRRPDSDALGRPPPSPAPERSPLATAVEEAAGGPDRVLHHLTTRAGHFVGNSLRFLLTNLS